VKRADLADLGDERCSQQRADSGDPLVGNVDGVQPLHGPAGGEYGGAVVFDVPGWPGHMAGQHVEVRLTAADGYTAKRSYSIVSPPDGQRVELFGTFGGPRLEKRPLSPNGRRAASG
jgi:hypothetical protein